MASYDKIEFEKTLNEYENLHAQRNDIVHRTHESLQRLEGMLRDDVRSDLEQALARHDLKLGQFRIEDALSGKFCVYIERIENQSGMQVGGKPHDGEKFSKVLGNDFRAIEQKYNNHIHIAFPFTWWDDMMED